MTRFRKPHLLVEVNSEGRELSASLQSHKGRLVVGVDIYRLGCTGLYYVCSMGQVLKYKTKNYQLRLSSARRMRESWS